MARLNDAQLAYIGKRLDGMILKKYAQTLPEIIKKQQFCSMTYPIWITKLQETMLERQLS